MPIVIPNEGAPYLTAASVGKYDLTPHTYLVHLFKNAYTPVPATVLADFEECDFPGYDPWSIDDSLWSFPAIVDDRAVSTYNPGTPLEVTNDSSSPTTIYGYYVEDVDLGVCTFCERFGTPRTLEMGQTMELTLKFTGGTYIAC